LLLKGRAANLNCFSKRRIEGRVTFIHKLCQTALLHTALVRKSNTPRTDKNRNKKTNWSSLNNSDSHTHRYHHQPQQACKSSLACAGDILFGFYSLKPSEEGIIFF
jgi:hypothetical protein